MIIDNALILKIKNELNKMYRNIGIRSQEFESHGFNITNEGDKFLIEIPFPSTLKRNEELIEKSKRIISKFLHAINIPNFLSKIENDNFIKVFNQLSHLNKPKT